MAYRRIIPPGYVQAPSLKRVLVGGYTQVGVFRPIRPGGWADIGGLTPLPPSLAPVLTVTADPSSFIAQLTWTRSNRTGSPGFTYQVWMKVDAGAFALLTSTTNLFLNTDQSPTAGTYQFYVKPVNTAGGGPDSNIVSVALPGESSNSFLLLNQGGRLLLNSGGALLING